MSLEKIERRVPPKVTPQIERWQPIAITSGGQYMSLEIINKP
jgi:hypothetical protein